MEPLLDGEVELYRNRQWVVTTEGIEPVEGRYWISKAQLMDEADNVRDWNDPAVPYTFIQHMAKKGWVDIEALIEAYLVACVIFGVQIPGIPRAIRWARRKVAHTQEYKAVEAELYPKPPGGRVIGGCETKLSADGTFELVSWTEFKRRDEEIEAEVARRRKEGWIEAVGVVVEEG